MADFISINPASGEKLAEYKYFADAQMVERLSLSQTAFQKWSALSLQQRCESLKKLAAEFRSQSANLSQQMALEMGKARKDCVAEIEKSAVTCEFFANQAIEYLTSEELTAGGKKAQILKQPIGPCFGIMPWNFPLWQIIRFAVPALAAGNSILLKHSDLVPGCAEMIEKIFQTALAIPEVYLNLRISHKQAEKVIADFQVRAVSFTGSTRGGRAVASLAGQHLKKSVLELGGSDAYLVFADADLKLAAQTCAKARLVNNGQSCVAAKRFFVENKIKTDFIKIMAEQMAAMKVGNPLDEKTDLGPLSQLKFKTELGVQVDRLLSQGAKLYWQAEGDVFRQTHAAFYPATILDMTAWKSTEAMWKEELFGPVALVWGFDSEEKAVELANQSLYGLGGAVFSRDLEKIKRVSQSLQCGFVAINDFVRSDPLVPFGGVKDSGYGRELSKFGILEFVNIKTVL